jgi:hypothetical protein
MEGRLSRQERARTWTWSFVLLGLGLRLYHYARNPSMWHDEAALVLNVLGKNFHELLGPLFYAEAAPPLFLWIERGVVLILGDGVYALRLVPLLASCAALVLLVPIARRLLHPQSVPWAVLLFACSDHLLWHACEAKPYAVDVAAATIVLALFSFMESRPFAWQIALYVAAAPCLIFVAYPGCFLCGGILVALLPAVYRSRRAGAWLGLGLLGAVVLGSFAVLLEGPIHAQRCQAMEQCWVGAFPNWHRPWTVPIWTTLSTFEVFRYCFEPIGQVLLLPAMLGARSLWRRQHQSYALLLVVPVLLALIASYAGAYPYGGSRVLVYATPALALLIAEGIPDCLTLAAQLRSWAATRTARFWSAVSSPMAVTLARWSAVALLLAPVGRAAQRVASPWVRADCAGAAHYVLMHRRTGEDIISNHWEYAYYFRHLGSDFSLENHPPRASEERLWVVATAGTYPERQSVVEAVLPRDWRIAERHEFPLSTVYLLARPTER